MRSWSWGQGAGHCGGRRAGDLSRAWVGSPGFAGRVGLCTGWEPEIGQRGAHPYHRRQFLVPIPCREAPSGALDVQQGIWINAFASSPPAARAWPGLPGGITPAGAEHRNALDLVPVPSVSRRVAPAQRVARAAWPIRGSFPSGSCITGRCVSSWAGANRFPPREKSGAQRCCPRDAPISRQEACSPRGAQETEPGAAQLRGGIRQTLKTPTYYLCPQPNSERFRYWEMLFTRG